MRKEIFKRLTIQNFLFYFIIFSFLLVTGCEPLARKFTRKPKKTVQDVEGPVLEPEEYPRVIQSKEDLYKEAYLFWRSWLDELVNFLEVNGNTKKQFSCIEEIIKNLEKMKLLLIEQKGKILDGYIKQLNELKEKILKGQLNNSTIYSAKSELGVLKRKIEKEFVYSHVKDYLK